MSVVVSWVDDAVAGIPIVNSAWDTIKDVADVVWQEVAAPVLEFVFSLLGIEDEDLVNVQVSSQRMIPDSVNKITNVAALRHQLHDEPILSNIAAGYADIKSRYRQYDSGADSFIDGRPESSLKVRVVDKEAVKDVLDSINGHDNSVLTASIKIPDKVEWVQWILQGTHAYKPYSNELTYSGNVYEYFDVLYNYSTDKYEVTVKRYNTVVTNVYVKTVVTVTNIDASTDNVHTAVYDTVETISSIDGTSIVDTLVSEDDEVVPVGTVENSEDLELVSTDESVVVYDSQVIEVIAHTAVQQYVVTYEWVTGEWYYWVYNKDSNVYHTLGTNALSVSGLEMLPIVAIRQNKVNVNSDKESSRYKSSKETLKLLNVDIDTMINGISDNSAIDNVTDAFVHFGIGVTDTDPIVSKALYLLADVCYNDPSISNVVATQGTGEEDVLAFNISEGNFNQVAKWDSQTREVKNGSIGTVGTYSHEVAEYEDQVTSGTTTRYITKAKVIVRKQELEESYIEYTFYGITSMTYIGYGGFGNLNTLTPVGEVASEFNIPLSMYFVKQLTASEQRVLFEKTLRVSIYALQVTHLEYYETAAFGMFLEFVAYVILIYSLGSAKDVSAVLITMATAIASSYVLKKILESNAPDWLKAVAVVAFVAVNIAAANLDGTQSGLMTGVQAVSLCSQACNIAIGVKSEELKAEQEVFSKKAKEREEENKAKEKANLIVSRLDEKDVLEVLTPYRLDNETTVNMANGTSTIYNYSNYYDYSSRVLSYDNMYKIGII